MMDILFNYGGQENWQGAECYVTAKKHCLRGIISTLDERIRSDHRTAVK